MLFLLLFQHQQLHLHIQLQLQLLPLLLLSGNTLATMATVSTSIKPMLQFYHCLISRLFRHYGAR